MRSRRAPDTARTARILILLLAALILVVTTAAGTPGRHLRLVADDPAPTKVTIAIASITPLSPGPKDTLRISGRVVSQSGADLTRLQVSLHLGTAVTSRTEMQGLRANPVAQLLAQPGTLDVGNGRLTAGHSAPFTISVPIKDLELTGDGVYPMQVLATGVEGAAAAPVDLTTVSTFLPYVTKDATSPATPLAWLVSLTANPSLLADGSLTNDDVVTAVDKGGRLSRLLDGLSAATAVTATIDPAVIRTLALTANGRYVVNPPFGGSAVTKPASSAASKWLSDLRAADQVSLVGLPYADPDVEALLHSGQGKLIDEASQRGDDVLTAGLGSARSRLTPSIVVPPGGYLDTQAAAYYQRTGAQGLVLASNAVPATGDNPSASASSPGVASRLLLSDQVLTKLVTDGPQSSPRLAEQDIVAELAESHLEDRVAAEPSTGGTAAATANATPVARPLLIAPPDNWSPSTAWLSALLTDTSHLSWLRQIPVSTLLDSPAEPRAGLQYPALARVSELPPSLVASSAQITADTEGLFREPQRGDEPQPRSPQSIVQPIRDAALTAVSSHWRGTPAQGEVFINSADQTYSALQQQVRVVASPQVTLTSKSGRVPVTLENNLDAAVDVSLVLTSLDRSRVSSDTVVKRTVRAGQKVQVEVEVKAASAGTFPVRLALFTPDGQPLGTPAQVLVRSTKYGVVATIFTIVALSVLGLAVLIRSIRALRRRSRRRGAESDLA